MKIIMTMKDATPRNCHFTILLHAARTLDQLVITMMITTITINMIDGHVTCHVTNRTDAILLTSLETTLPRIRNVRTLMLWLVAMTTVLVTDEVWTLMPMHFLIDAPRSADLALMTGASAVTMIAHHGDATFMIHLAHQLLTPNLHNVHVLFIKSSASAITLRTFLPRRTIKDLS